MDIEVGTVTPSRIKRWAIFGTLGLFGFFTLLGSWYTVQQTYRGVLTRNGAFVAVVEPGLHFKVPFIDGVQHIPVTTKTFVYDKLSAYSRDQQPAEIRFSVTYHVPPGSVGEVYARFGNDDAMVERLLHPKVYEELKNVFGQFNAVTAVQDRAKLNTEIEQALRAAVKGPILIESAQIENIDFSDAYEQSIEHRMLAEVEVQKLRQNSEREKVQAEIVVIQAQAQAKATVAAATASADAIRLRGDAEAAAIRARGEALKENQRLVELNAVEKWNGVLPTQMVPGSAVPFLNLGAAGALPVEAK